MTAAGRAGLDPIRCHDDDHGAARRGAAVRMRTVRAGRARRPAPGRHAAGVSIDDVLREQDGVISRRQALGCGMSASTVRRRLATGAWDELLPGVFLAGGHRAGDRVRVRAAWLWAGPSSVVTGLAAGYWFGLLGRAPQTVEVTVPRTVTRRSRPGVRVRRRDLDPADRTRHDGVGVGAIAATVLETAAGVPDGAAVLDRALQQRRVRFADLYQAYCRMVGCPGTARAATLLRGAADRADSALERRLVTALRRAGVTGFVLGYPFGDGAIDLAFPASMVAVEVDGWAWHVDPARFTADRVKGNALVAAGWHVLRFTWAAITDHPGDTVRQIMTALDDRGAGSDLRRGRRGSLPAQRS